MEIGLVEIIFVIACILLVANILLLTNVFSLCRNVVNNNPINILEHIDMMSEKQYKDVMKVVLRTEVLLDQLLRFEEESGKTKWDNLHNAFKTVNRNPRVDLNE